MKALQYIFNCFVLIFIVYIDPYICKDAYNPSSFTIIAHRGDSGTLPEETLLSFELAVLEGSHYSEFDLVFSKDGELFTRHEPNLLKTTNVTSSDKFQDKFKTYQIDTSPPEDGFFINDFTSDELKEIYATQANLFRDHTYDNLGHIPTADEMFCALLKVNLWREWLTYEASKWEFSLSSYNWEFGTALKTLWDESTDNSTHTFFTTCLDGITFAKTSNFTIPLQKIEGNKVFSYLKPNLDPNSPFKFFNPVIKQFFPFGTVLDGESTNKSWYTFSCKFYNWGYCKNYSYFPDYSSAKEFKKKYPDPFGLLVELKHSAWFKDKTGYHMPTILEEKLKNNHLDLFSSHIIIQSFDQTDLIYFSKNNDYPLVQLMMLEPLTQEACHYLSNADNSISIVTADTDYISSFAYGVGPSKDLVISLNPVNDYADSVSKYIKEWSNAGLKIFPYTFRNEYFFIPLNFNQDPYRELADFFQTKIDGFITDFPKTAFLFIEHFLSDDSSINL